jgi:regulator of ribonuclease activity A
MSPPRDEELELIPRMIVCSRCSPDRPQMVLDQYGAQAIVCNAPFVQYGGVHAFAGRIATIVCEGDLSLVSERVTSPGDDRVLVVDAKGSLRLAMAGDGIATHAHANGWAGLVIWGAIRDVDLLRDVPLGVKALGANPRAAGKSGGGSMDVTVEFGGVVFQPGSFLFSDTDGIVVVNGDVV